MDTKILGSTFTDKVTGFVGVATAVCHYIDGETQILLAPKTTLDGAFREAQWFNIKRLLCLLEDPSFTSVDEEN